MDHSHVLMIDMLELAYLPNNLVFGQHAWIEFVIKLASK